MAAGGRAGRDKIASVGIRDKEKPDLTRVSVGSASERMVLRLAAFFCLLAKLIWKRKFPGFGVP
ncbi:hypothetical protein DV515_00014265 [Chloebia gouldiae]|uniref:Uncharacterized protein n=1 Tax=Chloebia gouldiae TaxID=44316 RepID=A0A3L8RZS2_CHLGU|nr:hypothetical protein DV515_00014265 [Chloebia gouldiae]